MTSGLGMRLKLDTAALLKKHRLTPAAPVHVPLAPDDIAGRVTLSGLASTSDIDLTRTRFRPWCFVNKCLHLSSQQAFPKFHWKHDETLIAGEVTSMQFDAHGQVRISVDTDHPHARRAGAFSIGAKILGYELKNGDLKDFYFEVTAAEITEISGSDHPANPQCLVQSRSRAAPLQAYLATLQAAADLEIKAVRALQSGFELLRAELAKPALERTDRKLHSEARPRPAIAKEPHRQSDFGRMIQKLEELHPS